MKAIEQQIIQSILAGRKERYGELMAMYGDKLLSFVSVAVSNRHDAEDITEEAFVNAYIHLGQFDAGKASFYTWLRSIAWHEIKRQQRTHPDRPCQDEGWTTTGPSPEDDDDRKLDILSECIDELNAEQQMLLKLHYTDELPLKEIAVILGSKPENLANQLMRLRRKLQKMIVEKEKKSTPQL